MSVLFDVLSIGTATADVDFNVVNSEVFFEEGQRRKPLPLRILDDRLAERREWLVIRLARPSGGAKIGTPAECNVTIAASDDPNGAFGIMAPAKRLDPFVVGLHLAVAPLI